MRITKSSTVEETKKSFPLRVRKFLFSKETYTSLFALVVCFKDALILKFRYKAKRLLGGKVHRKSYESHDNPLFSVIMPSFNRKTCITDAIFSVLAQSYKNYELIIVDDGSSDGSIDFIEGMFEQELRTGKIRLLKLPENKGVCYARNLGLKNAKGDIICYLDSDNKWCSWYLDYIAEHYTKNADCKLAYTAMLSINRRINTCSILGEDYDFDRMMKANYIDMNVFSHRASLLAKYGGFDTELKRLVDYELIMRFAHHCPPAFLNRVGAIYIYRQGIETITSSQAIDYQEALEIAQKKILEHVSKEKTTW